MDGLLDHGGVALVEGGAALGKTALLNECARLIHGLYWLTANMADGQSVLISVDDAQWADSASMRWLAYLAPRLDGLAVAVVVAERATPTARHGAATSAIRSVAGSIRPTLLDAAAPRRSCDTNSVRSATPSAQCCGVRAAETPSTSAS